MKLSEDLRWRGLINQTTYKNIDVIDKPGIKFYFGVDPSADSMTIGNLAAVLLVSRFLKAGHKAVVLAGGATGRIGDPDGKKDERNLKTIEEVEHNVAGIQAQLKKILASDDVEIVNNYDWFKDINFLDFLREVGKKVPMNQMLGRDFVKSRLSDEGTGISYAEFSYSLIQGYDFVHLNEEKGVTLQLCGADQWGNSITGIDLARRINGAELNVLSMPLVINKATGVKFGKSEGGAVWLDAKKTSPYKFYQFWLNVDDESVIYLMKIYTFFTKSEIEAIETKHNENPSLRIAQKALAEAVTEIVHGKEITESVKKVTDVLFGGADFKDLSENDINQLATEIPVVGKGNLINILVESGISKSNGEARRLLLGNAISVNGGKVIEDIEITEFSLIKKGKNSFILVK